MAFDRDQRSTRRAAHRADPEPRQSWPMAAYADHAEDIDTDLLVQGFAREAKGRGAQILTEARVSAIAKDGDGLARHRRAAGEFTARMLVNAAGAWVDQVAAHGGGPPPGLHALPPVDGAHPGARAGMTSATGRCCSAPGEDWYAKPDAGRADRRPAEEDLMDPHDAWADDMVLAEGLARYEEMVTEPVTRLISQLGRAADLLARPGAGDRARICASRRSSGWRVRAAMGSRPARRQAAGGGPDRGARAGA